MGVAGAGVNSSIQRSCAKRGGTMAVAHAGGGCVGVGEGVTALNGRSAARATHEGSGTSSGVGL